MVKTEDEKELLKFLQGIFGTSDDISNDEIWPAFAATYMFGKQRASYSEEEPELGKFDVDPFILRPNQKIDGNDKVTEFADGWKLHEWVEKPEKYHYKES